MAEPLSASAFISALQAEGCKVVEVGDWRTHNRNHKGPWGPVNGTIVHHTVTRGTANTVAIVRDGYAELPGPLCHGMIAKDGTVYLVGYGRTNHAGGGDPKVLAHVIAEDYDNARLYPTKGNKDGVDGNAHFYGWECENLGDGKDPWPAAQYDAIVRATAAVIRAHRAKGDDWGLEALSIIGHLEWSQDKSDPRGFPMPGLRLDAAERLEHSASWNPTDEEEDMTPDQEARQKRIEAKLDTLLEERRIAPWQYRNEDEDAEAKKLGKRSDDGWAKLTKTLKGVQALQNAGLTSAQIREAAEAGAHAALAELADRLKD